MGPQSTPGSQSDWPSFDGGDVERVVAVGGSSVVYAARLRRRAEVVALKTVRIEHASDARAFVALEREVELCGRVLHANVARVLDVGRLHDGRPFFTMPLYGDHTLASVVRREGPLGVPRAVRLVDQLLLALEAVHAARLVHCDVHPSNVVVSRDERLALVDLGYAAEAGPSDAVERRVAPAFASPEQATGARALDGRSDVFAASAVLHFALTGDAPFGPTRAVVRDAPVPLRRHRRDAPVALERLVARGLSKHPDLRFPGAAAMRAELLAAAA